MKTTKTNRFIALHALAVLTLTLALPTVLTGCKTGSPPTETAPPVPPPEPGAMNKLPKSSTGSSSPQPGAGMR